MKRALLDRCHQDDYCTLGVLCDDGTRKEICATLELPWHANEHGRSCIPTGTYHCKLRWSEKHQREVYEVTGVPGRSDIEIHSANWPSELLGCIATGTRFGVIEGKRGIKESRIALEKLMVWADGIDFELVVQDATEGICP